MASLAPAFAKLRTHDRLTAVARSLGIQLERQGDVTIAARAELLVQLPAFNAQNALLELTRDELASAVEAYGEVVESPARIDYIDAILRSVGGYETLLREETERHKQNLDERAARGELPQKGDEVRLRQGAWLVTAVHRGGVRPSGERELTRVEVVGLSDDRQGEQMEVLWELELGARVASRRTEGFESIERFDDPALFGAWLDAIRWQGVTARDSQIFQSPFRAGVAHYDHQLVPLARALSLPRANLFIADDVGLGKTIEAGLIIQELRLRQRVDQVLIVAPPAICVQWQEEMRDRFGINFAVYNREYINKVRRDRGFRVNPFSTHNHFIISYHMLRRPEHREPLFDELGKRRERSLLILDEAHTAAPATSSVYAVDSQVTKVVRSLAPRFENRLFLSATPHNGHSNSFSSLLEMLDPQRFNRGVPVDERAKLELDKVMVRRLKSDLREWSRDFVFPRRHIETCRLEHRDGAWYGRFPDDTGAGDTGSSDTAHDDAADNADEVMLKRGAPVEIELADKLRAYSQAASTLEGYPAMVFTTLQKRLLSSVDAFYRTFAKHCVAADKTAPAPAQHALSIDETSEAWDEDNDVVDEYNAEMQSLGMTSTAELREMRADILDLARKNRTIPDAKAAYLFEWMRRNMCPAIGADRDRARDLDRSDHGREKRADDCPDHDTATRNWNNRRVIVFTEYTHTLKQLKLWLGSMLEETDRPELRVAVISGSTDSDAREEIKRRFNASPDKEPLRILLATDAAREGINLQSSCYDLFHYDLPWNPARLEQRNGRIDRQMQPSEHVYCRHFRYEQREEDRVLDTLVRKIDTIQNELGSLGSILFDRVGQKLDRGINDSTAADIEHVEADDESTARVRQELGQTREAIGKEINLVGRKYQKSRIYSGFDKDRLHDVVNTALQRLGFATLAPTKVELSSGVSSETVNAWTLTDEFPNAWQSVVDSIRVPLPAGEPPWKFQEQPLRPVVFEAPPLLTSEVVHLHLEHPFVKRLLTGFRSSGFATRMLQRVTCLVDDETSVPAVVLYGRLTMFGGGAKRLHDEVIAVATEFNDATGELEPAVRVDEQTLKRVESLIRKDADHTLNDSLEARLCAMLPDLVDTAWEWLEAEADAIAAEVGADLEARGEEEAGQLRDILENQKDAIQTQLNRQLEIFAHVSAKDEQRQLELDKEFMTERMTHIDSEIESEPDELRELYKVVFERVEPIGAVVLWPGSR